jgi:isopentenyl phosphate kinase
MTYDIVFLKLGGSLITDKDTPYTPRLDKLQSLAREIKSALDSRPNMQLILGHGSGSFGHTAAKKYGTRDGVKRPDRSEQEYWYGFAEVRFQAAELTRYVMQALLGAGIAAIPVSPSAAMVSTNRQVTAHNILVMRKALNARLLPVVHGDVAFDEALGGTILSTEDVFTFLAEQFPVTRILLAGIEAGVWADFPARKKLVKEIQLGAYGKIRAGIGGSASTDVTGGMKAKVEEMFALIEKKQDLTVQIFSAEENGFLTRALNGENMGTLLSI